MRETKRHFLILLIVAVFAIFNSTPELPVGPAAPSVQGATTARLLDFPVVPDTKLVSIPVPRRALAAPAISAKSLLVRDTQSGVTILEKNAGEKLPVASLTKLMTALVVVDHAALDEVVDIKNSDLAVAPYRINFAPPESLTVKDLLTAMLVASANDAAMSLSRYTKGSVPEFVAAMNDKALELRMLSTAFTNPVGLDSEGHYSTAADLARLVEEFMNHTELLDIVKIKSAQIRSVSGREKLTLYTTNRLLVENPEVIGLKTGYTAEAGGSLIVLTNKYYSIILGSADRERETALVMQWIEDNFLWK